MKFKGMAGDFGFPALIKNGNGWRVTTEIYFNKPEVVRFNEGLEVIWPTEVLDNGSIYFPDESELE